MICHHNRAEKYAGNSSASAGEIHWCPRCGGISVDGDWRLPYCSKARKAPTKSLPGESRKAKRKRRRTTHREETAAIRAAVWGRANGMCECRGECGRGTKGNPCGFHATELHHLEGGSGRRRQKQTVENCRAYCFDCHRAAHRASRRSAP